MDFTLKIYKQLLLTLQKRNYKFSPFIDFISDYNQSSHNSAFAIIILRHDVDRLPYNSLNTAKLENEFGIKGSYYFRTVPESYDLNVMKQIAGLGHEIGYHYEDVDLVSQKSKIKSQKLEMEELIDLAYESFCKNLEMLRKDFDVKTICMHGSPRSKYDNKIIWNRYSYKDLGIMGEPYLDLNFSHIAYLTDTGRKWNGDKVSVRDKVNSNYHFNFKTTKQIINNIGILPNQIMFTIHPQRWTDNVLQWTNQLILQNVKNVVKGIIIKRQHQN